MRPFKASPYGRSSSPKEKIGRSACQRVLDRFDEFRALVDALEAVGLEYAACGGLDVAIPARPRATLDVDLLVVPAEQFERAREVGRRLGYRIETQALVIRRDGIERYRLSNPTQRRVTCSRSISCS